MQQRDALLPRVQRPARYAGGEWNSIIKDWAATQVRIALAYPDLYEAAATQYSVTLLYDLINRHSNLVAERVFSPWLDLEAELRRTGTPLFSLETKQPLRAFDLWYLILDAELTYTNALTMLDLAGVPLTAAPREQPFPIILAGGACVFNAEPLAEVLDAVILGEAEVALLEICEAVQEAKHTWEAHQVTPGRAERRELLRRLASLQGVYVPSLYRPAYAGDGRRLLGLEPSDPSGPPVVHRRAASLLPPMATRPIVPYLATVHDRAGVEVGRGPAQSCALCQGEGPAEPPRIRSHNDIIRGVEALIRNTGYTEVALLLPGGHEADLSALVRLLRERFRNRVRLTLPALPVSEVSEELLSSLGGGQHGTLALEPVAGSQRLRQAAGQPGSAADLLRAAEVAFRAGYEHLRLAFCIGLPGETLEDVQEILDLAREAAQIGRQHAGPRARVSVEADIFIPKAGSRQPRATLARRDELAPKIDLLKRGLRGKALKFRHQGYEEAMLEAVLARGDRRLGAAVLRAWKLGARFDGRPERSAWEIWQRAFQETGIDAEWYVYRERAADEVLPWSHLHHGVSPGDLLPVHDVCSACGLPHRQDAPGL